MNKKADPLGILESTGYVMNNAGYVRIVPEAIGFLVKKLERYHRTRGTESAAEAFGRTGSLKSDVQLVFLEDAVNFCFWPDRGVPKWRVDAGGKTVDGGWYGLRACFERALTEDVPILDANFLVDIGLKDTGSIFRGIDGVEIPLLAERRNNLREAGWTLIDKYDGHFVHALERGGYNVVRLVELIVEDFPSFNDAAKLDGREVRFYKRAQICAFDISYVLAEHNARRLESLDELTAFADYKLPQMLRLFGVLEYAEDLADKVDRQVDLPAGSREEIEIRAATVQAIELIARQTPELSAATIDNLLWLISQDGELQERSQPYHRTRTIYY